jgi:hypothetical protein
MGLIFPVKKLKTRHVTDIIQALVCYTYNRQILGGKIMKNNKLLIVMLVLLLISNVLTYGRVGRLENDLSNVKNNLYHMDNNIREISNDVSWQLNRFTEENAWTRMARAEAVTYNEANETAGVEIKVEFNELRVDEEISILVQDDKGNLMDSIEATDALNKTMNLNLTFDLPMGKDYTLSVVGQSAQGRRSDDLGGVYLANVMEALLYVHGYGWDFEMDENGDYTSIGLDIMADTNFAKDSFTADYMKEREMVDMRGDVFINGDLADTIDFFGDESWQISGGFDRGGQHENFDEETAAMPHFKPGIAVEFYMDIHGTYVFNEAVSADDQIEFLVVFTDNLGDQYSYPLERIFD